MIDWRRLIGIIAGSKCRTYLIPVKQDNWFRLFAKTKN